MIIYVDTGIKLFLLSWYNTLKDASIIDDSIKYKSIVHDYTCIKILQPEPKIYSYP